MDPDKQFRWTRDGVLAFTVAGAVISTWLWFGQSGDGWLDLVWMLAVSFLVLLAVFSVAAWAFNRLFAWGARRADDEGDGVSDGWPGEDR